MRSQHIRSLAKHNARRRSDCSESWFGSGTVCLPISCTLAMSTVLQGALGKWLGIRKFSGPWHHIRKSSGCTGMGVCMALWVAAGSGRAEVATGELQGDIWSEKVPILMCLGAEESWLVRLPPLGVTPELVHINRVSGVLSALIRGKGTQGIWGIGSLWCPTGKTPLVPCSLGMVYRNPPIYLSLASEILL